MSDKQPWPTGLQVTAADPVFREHPHEYLDRLSTEDPVHRDAELGRLFLTRFEEVRGQARPRYEASILIPEQRTILHDARKKVVEAVKKDDVMCNKVMTAALTRAALKMQACVHKPLAPIGAWAFRTRRRLAASLEILTYSGRDFQHVRRALLGR